MLTALKDIVTEHIEYSKQILPLAKVETKKSYRGSALGMVWLFVKPLTYIFVFWFALEVGLKVGGNQGGNIPYIVWLTAGLVPWFYMQSMLLGGSRVYSRYGYLVTKIKFPISVVPTFVSLSQFFTHLCLMVVLFGMYFLCGGTLSVYLLQIPLLWILILAFFGAWSLFSSLLSAISKDFSELIKALTTPIFWISGVIFDISHISSEVLQTFFAFNPVSFFARGFRMAFTGSGWFWGDLSIFGPFCICLIGQFLLMLWAYKRCKKDVPDVL